MAPLTAKASCSYNVPEELAVPHLPLWSGCPAHCTMSQHRFFGLCWSYVNYSFFFVFRLGSIFIKSVGIFMQSVVCFCLQQWESSAARIHWNVWPYHPLAFIASVFSDFLQMKVLNSDQFEKNPLLYCSKPQKCLHFHGHCLFILRSLLFRAQLRKAPPLHSTPFLLNASVFFFIDGVAKFFFWLLDISISGTRYDLLLSTQQVKQRWLHWDEPVYCPTLLFLNS